MAPQFRIGTGWDSHVFVPGRPLWLGGIAVDHPRGLQGHSDGDVLLHALCDALLGGLALGDIGSHFPSSDPQWHQAASSLFVRHAVQLVHQHGWQIVNVDANLILAAPAIAPLRSPLQENLALLLDIPGGQISVKGKTPEGLHTDDTAIAQVVVLLSERRP